MERRIEQRLKQIFTKLGVNVSSVERECGFSPNSLRTSLDRGSAIGSDRIETILAHYPDISAEWLFRGECPMTRADQSVGDIIGSNAVGVNVNGDGASVTNSGENAEERPMFLEIIRGYQKSIEYLQNHINELATIIQNEQSKNR